MKSNLPLSGMLISAIMVSYITANAATPELSPLSAGSVQQIEQVIHDYLVNNPQVLVEASQALRDQMQKNQEENAVTGIKENAKALFNDPNSPIVGNTEALVSIVEFFDYQCSHCKDMTGAINNLISNNKNVRIVFKELPIFGGTSEYAAKAALAAQKQGKFYAFHEALMKEKNPLTKESITAVAQSVGLNTDTLAKDMNSAEVKDEIKHNFQLAQGLQLMGTPAFILGNKAGTQFSFIPGAASEQKLNEEIKKINQ